MQIMIFAGELNGSRLSLFYTGYVKYLKENGRRKPNFYKVVLMKAHDTL